MPALRALSGYAVAPPRLVRILAREGDRDVAVSMPAVPLAWMGAWQLGPAPAPREKRARDRPESGGQEAMIMRIVVCFVALSTVALAQRAFVPPARSHHPDIPYQSPVSLGAASYAKVLCSAVFVSGRDSRRRQAEQRLLPDDRARSQETGHRRCGSRREAGARDGGERDAHRRVLRRSGLRDPSCRSRRRALHARPGAHDAA